MPDETATSLITTLALGLDAHEAIRRYLARRAQPPTPQGKRAVAEDLPPIGRSQALPPGRPGEVGGSVPPEHPEPRGPNPRSERRCQRTSTTGS
jgi:hypothetical protein